MLKLKWVKQWAITAQQKAPADGINQRGFSKDCNLAEVMQIASSTSQEKEECRDKRGELSRKCEDTKSRRHEELGRYLTKSAMIRNAQYILKFT